MTKGIECAILEAKENGSNWADCALAELEKMDGVKRSFDRENRKWVIKYD